MALKLKDGFRLKPLLSKKDAIAGGGNSKPTGLTTRFLSELKDALFFAIPFLPLTDGLKNSFGLSASLWTFPEFWPKPFAPFAID